jgi:hypothetical protein
MSVRTVTDVSVPATPVESIRCYNLTVDGQIKGASGIPGTFLISSLNLTGTYANDSYSAAMNGCAYTKFGYIVNLQLKQFEHTVVSAGSNFVFGTLPSDLRPASTQRYPIYGINGGTLQVSTLEIQPSGVITLYNGVNSTYSAGLGGIAYPISITYTIN